MKFQVKKVPVLKVKIAVSKFRGYGGIVCERVAQILPLISLIVGSGSSSEPTRTPTSETDPYNPAPGQQESQTTSSSSGGDSDPLSLYALAFLLVAVYISSSWYGFQMHFFTKGKNERLTKLRTQFQAEMGRLGVPKDEPTRYDWVMHVIAAPVLLFSLVGSLTAYIATLMAKALGMKSCKPMRIAALGGTFAFTLTSFLLALGGHTVLAMLLNYGASVQDEYFLARLMNFNLKTFAQRIFSFGLLQFVPIPDGMSDLASKVMPSFGVPQLLPGVLPKPTAPGEVGDAADNEDDPQERMRKALKAATKRKTKDLKNAEGMQEEAAEEAAVTVMVPLGMLPEGSTAPTFATTAGPMHIFQLSGQDELVVVVDGTQVALRSNMQQPPPGIFFIAGPPAVVEAPSSVASESSSAAASPAAAEPTPAQAAPADPAPVAAASDDSANSDTETTATAADAAPADVASAAGAADAAASTDAAAAADAALVDAAPADAASADAAPVDAAPADAAPADAAPADAASADAPASADAAASTDAADTAHADEAAAPADAVPERAQ